VHYVAEGGLESFRSIENKEAPLAVRIETLPPRRFAFVRDVGPYQEIGATWGRLMAWAGQRGLFRSNPLLLGIVHDDPEITPPDHLRYDAAITVTDGVAAEKGVGIQLLAGGRYAVALHCGQYQKISHTYARVCGEWLPKSGRELLSSPSLEVYRNSPRDVEPENLLTDIYLPLTT
jgi:AraC family transcriptional regulator